MQTPPKYQINQSLSLRLFRWVMLTALVAGLILSVFQILLDANRASTELDQQSLALLELVNEPATQAVYSIDAHLGDQVIEGLFKQPFVNSVTIAHPEGSILAERHRPLLAYDFRFITDALFEKTRTYSLRLERNHSGKQTYFGTITLTIDTLVTAQSFLARSLVIFLSGLIKALIFGSVLYIVYHYLLTKPISELISSLLSIDANAPEKTAIPTPKGHEKDELGAWVDSANSLLTEISESQMRRQAAEARALKLAQYDALTGLPNRRLLRNQLQNVIAEAKSQQQSLAIFCCGLDDFKSINDQFDYNIGDSLLKAFAERLSAQSRYMQIAARLGGDQFVLVILPPDEDALLDQAESLISAMNLPFLIDGQRITLRTTIGVSRFPHDGKDADKLLQKAEQTMTLAKSLHRNKYCFYEESVDARLRERKQLERDLSSAIANGELFMVYQPQFDINSNSVVGAEALIRWQHPVHGLIPPIKFINIAEDNGQIAEIGQWVINHVCQQIKQWQSFQIECRIAVNVSAIQLNNPALASHVIQALSTARIQPDSLEIEVTETGVMQNPEKAIATLSKLQKSGIQISIDDFGTGYSSLSYLKKLPISTLKVDKQFVDDLLTDKENATIVNAMIQLAHNLNYKVVAEGVETKAQHLDLKARGCDIGQGYLYAKPMRASEFAAFLQTHKKLSGKHQEKDNSHVN
ncbi:MAG: EAL domain-containing protein [Hahellaceae bacterium]|nr:EAL domain-containing protein [Hahellaceae bacterium]